MRRSVRSLFAVGALLFGSTEHVRAAPPGPAPQATELGRGVYAPFADPLDVRLPNGLRIVAQRDPRQPLVAFLIAYEVGSRDDPPGYEGLAHLVEHLTFSGSRHLRRYQIAAELERAGALRFNGATGDDYTYYYSLLPARSLALPFWLESERMGFTLERFNADSLAHESTIVEREGVERMLTRFDYEVLKKLFPASSPYRFVEPARDGSPDVSLSGAQWFFQTHYRPDNATIVVVGDFEPGVLTRLATRYFGSIVNPPGRVRRARPAARRFAGREQLTVVEYWIPSRRVLMVWPGPSLRDPDSTTMRVVGALLRRRGAASLSYRLRNADLASSVDIRATQSDADGLFWVDAVLEPDVKYEIAEHAIGKHLFELSQTGPPPAELEATKEELKTWTLVSVQDPLNHAELHLDHLRAFGTPFRLGEYLGEIDAVTPARIREFAKKYLSPSRRLSAWHRVTAEKESVPNDGRVDFEVLE